MAETTTVPDDELDGLFESVMRCEAAITQEQLDQIEKQFQSRDAGVARRIGLVIASKAGDWFKQLSEDHETAAAIAEALPVVQDHVQRLRDLADLLESGRTRAIVALCNHVNFDVETCTMRKAAS